MKNKVKLSYPKFGHGTPISDPMDYKFVYIIVYVDLSNAKFIYRIVVWFGLITVIRSLSIMSMHGTCNLEGIILTMFKSVNFCSSA